MKGIKLISSSRTHGAAEGPWWSAPASLRAAEVPLEFPAEDARSGPASVRAALSAVRSAQLVRAFTLQSDALLHAHDALSPSVIPAEKHSPAEEDSCFYPGMDFI